VHFLIKAPILAQVDQYIMNKFGGGATVELPPGGGGGHFPKWPPADITDAKK